MSYSRLDSAQVFDFAHYKIREQLQATFNPIKPIISLAPESGSLEFDCGDQIFYLLKPVVDADPTDDNQANLVRRLEQIRQLKEEKPNTNLIFIIPLEKSSDKSWAFLTCYNYERWEFCDPQESAKLRANVRDYLTLHTSGSLVEVYKNIYQDGELKSSPENSGYFVGSLIKAKIAPPPIPNIPTIPTNTAPEKIEDLVKQVQQDMPGKLRAYKESMVLDYITDSSHANRLHHRVNGLNARRGRRLANIATGVFGGGVAGMIVGGAICLVLVALTIAFPPLAASYAAFPWIMSGCTALGMAIGGGVAHRRSLARKSKLAKESASSKVVHPASSEPGNDPAKPSRESTQKIKTTLHIDPASHLALPASGDDQQPATPAPAIGSVPDKAPIHSSSESSVANFSRRST